MKKLSEKLLGSTFLATIITLCFAIHNKFVSMEMGNSYFRDKGSMIFFWLAGVLAILTIYFMLQVIKDNK